MIDKVIVCGLRRAGNLVPRIEVAQMTGRVGRSYEANAKGDAIILVPSEDVKYAKQYLYGDLPSIQSEMNEIENLAFHILPAIYDKEVIDKETAQEWYSKTLASFQGKKFDYDKLMHYLFMLDMIKYVGHKIQTKRLAEVSCKFYFRPVKVFTWKEKIEFINDRNKWEDTAALSWLLATEERKLYVDEELMQLYESECGMSGLYFEENEKMEGLIYYCLLKGYKPKELKFSMSECYEDIDRTINALLYMNRFCRWGIERELNILSIRIKKKVENDVADFMFESKIYNKTLVLKLFSLGYTSYKELKENFSNVKNYLEDDVVEKLEGYFKNE